MTAPNSPLPPVAEEDRYECPECNGWGQVDPHDLVCPLCHGNGRANCYEVVQWLLDQKKKENP